MTKNLSASIRARLLAIAQSRRTDFQALLVLFFLERLLYRLSKSAHADRFLLKGALLFTLWYDLPHRTTRDADLLGFGPSDLTSIAGTFKEIAAIDGDDGLVFDPASILVEEIRKEADYAGARVLIEGEIAKARCKTQIDIGFGDAVTPEPLYSVYPTLIKELAAPQLRTYPVHSVVSEKLHAIALLGMANSRLKDYFDLWIVLQREHLDADTLARAIAATFVRRGMAVPTLTPIGLTEEFASDPSRQTLWLAFIRKNGLTAPPLGKVVNILRARLLPSLEKAASIASTS